MVAGGGGGGDGDVENGSAGVPDYEKIRQERIKENLARMQSMGIFDLSRQLNSFKPNPPLKRVRQSDPSDQTKTRNPIPTRRSSRLQNVAPVSYVQSPRKPSLEPKRRRVRDRDRDRDPSLAKQSVRRRSSDSESDSDSESESESELDLDSDTVFRCRIPVPNSGSPPRRSSRLRAVAPVSYVETSPKVERKPSESVSRESSVDSYGGEGKRIYDGVKDETCHQCRQRTLDELTHCSKCDLVQGQFCGDCLDMGYGENVIEANQSPDWVCPVCRGICNCNLCLRSKELMHDNIKEEMEEGHLVGKEEMKEVNFMGSEHVPAEDVGKLDAVTIAGVVVDGEAKKQPRRSTRRDSAHVAAEDMGNLDAAGDVDGETKKQPRSTRMDSAHISAEDMGNIDAAGDVDGETKKQPSSTRMDSAHVSAEDVGNLDAAGDVDGETKKQPRSMRMDCAHVAAEDVGNLDAAADLVDGESKKQPRRSTRTRRN